MHFAGSVVCNKCGVPVAGEDASSNLICDDCTTTRRPWNQGRTAILYKGKGRNLVLGLKHGDRQDVVRSAAQWMVRAARALSLGENTLVVPVPLHWRRQLQRRYNQAALLAAEFGRLQNLEVLDDALRRYKRTDRLDGKTRDERFVTLQNAIRIAPRHADVMRDRPVLIIDDVLTSGATLAACSEACRKAGAKHVSVLALARAARDA